MTNKRKTTTRYRDGLNGEFITEKKAKRMNPARVIKERVPTPGNGDTR